MLERLSTWALRLRRWQGTLVVLALALLVVVIALALTTASERADRWLLLALIGLLWTGGALVFILAFAEVPPATVELPPGWPRRWARLNRWFHWALALVFSGLVLSAVSLTGRLFEEWQHSG